MLVKASKRGAQGALWCLAATAVLVAAIANAAPPKSPATAWPAAAAPAEEMVSQLMIKPHASTGVKLAGALQRFDASALSLAAAVPLSVVRPMSGGAHVLRLAQPVTLSEARVIAARLMRDSSVELAEPDRIMRAAATIPTDPGYAQQWHYYAPGGANLGGANLPNAWDVTRGNASVTVAVIDTGYRQHVDLGPVLPGYNFISSPWMANNGGVGRSPDAQDTGDWITASDLSAQPVLCLGEQVRDSGWHGTHVTGTIAALMNNAQGGAGVAPNVKILPVRVLGKCGGSMLDIIDAMRWAAGITVPGVPANPHPAQVLNLSLGGGNTCSVGMQSAVNDVIAAGKVVVAAAGNDGAIGVLAPANCTGVIAVTAHAINGDNAWYANVGPEVALSAPGGGCGAMAGSSCTNGPGVYSTLNTGTTVPAVDSYVAYQGTSMATPHVAGVAALMFSVKPGLTPVQVKSYLQSSVRPHPSGTACMVAYPGQCGAGLLDATNALNAIPAAPPIVSLTIAPSRVVAPGTTVALSGSATADPARVIGRYAWTQSSGSPVGAISGANTANGSFTAPATGTSSFTLTAADNTGRIGSATAIVRVNSPPVLTAVPAQSGTAGDTISFNVGATDADGDTPIFNSVSLPSGATLSASGAFSWPNAGPAGTYTLTYYARDNDADSSTGSVTITLAAARAAAGGGGSLDPGALLALALLAGWLRIRRAANGAAH